MQINPLSGTGTTPNNTYDSANYAAGEAQFSQQLKEAERKAMKGYGAGHVVNSEMRKTVPEDPMFGKSNAMDIFEDMRDTELMKATAEAGGIGLADIIYKQLAPSVLRQEAMEYEQGIK